MTGHRVRAAGAAMALGFALLAGSAQATDCPGVCGAEGLAPFFHALGAVKSGERRRPVHIIQIGDSHTANDYIAGALRDQLQYAYGHGGRGVLPPGVPYAGFDPRLIQVSQSGGWRVNLSFAPAPNPRHPEQPHLYVSPPPFGITGFRQIADTDSIMTLDAEAGAAFTRAVVCAIAEPGAGALSISAGGEEQRFSLAADDRRPVCHTARFAAPRQHLQLTTSGGSVSILSWATFGDEGGVALSNLGVSGTQLKDLAERNERVMATEFDAYQPDLIILAYGTNEGYVPHADVAAYEALLREQISRLRRLSHDTPILVLGAPDADTLRPDLYGSGGTFDCAPLSEDQVQNYPALVASHAPSLAHWYPPAGLAEIRAAQRRAAEAEGAAFWDWEAREGGPCSAHRMGLEDPKLVRGDHIHYTPEGGVKIAGLLYQDLMSADRAVGGAP